MGVLYKGRPLQQAVSWNIKSIISKINLPVNASRKSLIVRYKISRKFGFLLNRSFLKNRKIVNPFPIIEIACKHSIIISVAKEFSIQQVYQMIYKIALTYLALLRNPFCSFTYIFLTIINNSMLRALNFINFDILKINATKIFKWISFKCADSINLCWIISKNG